MIGLSAHNIEYIVVPLSEGVTTRRCDAPGRVSFESGVQSITAQVIHITQESIALWRGKYGDGPRQLASAVPMERVEQRIIC
jgi:hypothetical protein